MKKHKTYNHYKDSKIDWIGKIPEHWEVIRIKNIFQEINERSETGKENLLSVSQYTGITKRADRAQEGDLLTNAVTLEGYKLVKEKDLVSNIMLAWNGSLGFSPYNGIVSPAYSIYRLKKDDDFKYFHYLLRTEIYKAEFKRKSTGVIESRLRLYTDSFFNIQSILPPKEEQTAIAHFLDEKTSKIDRAVQIKGREIELLKERRQILIQEVVTGKKVWNEEKNTWTKPEKTKDSGVDCLTAGEAGIGEIPEDWEVRKLTHLFSEIGSGTTPSSSDKRYYNGDINFLQTGDLTDGIVYKTSRKITQKALNDYSGLKLYPKNSLVIAMYGATIGKLGILNDSSTTNQACCVLGNPKGISIKYFFFTLLSFRKEIVSMGYGGGQPNISQDLIKSLRFPIAPIKKQKQIVSYLENLESKIAQSISLKEQEIEKLKEYKTVLIDSAVTGKIRVPAIEKVEG